MADEELLHKIQGLGDLDLAALLCLISREHCIIGTEPEAMDDLVAELQLVATETFNLKPTVVSLNASTTLDDFAASILLPTTQTPSRSSSPLHVRNTSAAAQDSYFQASHQHRSSALSPLTPISNPSQAGPGSSPTPTPSNNTNVASGSYAGAGATSAAAVAAGGIGGGPQIANVVLARDLDRAPKAVQIQALELLRTRRLFTRTSVQAAPKQFLFVAVLAIPSGGQPIAGRLADHLNDFFYLAHWHDPLAGFAHLDDGAAEGDDDYYYYDDDAGGKRGKGAGPGGYGNNGPTPGSPYLGTEKGNAAADASRDVDSDESVVHRRPSRTHTPMNEPAPPQTPVRGPRQSRRSKGKKDKKVYGRDSGDGYYYEESIDPRRRARSTATANATPPPPPPPSPFIAEADLTTLSMASRAVTVDIDVLRYQMNLVTFLRMHRAVGLGVGVPASPTSPLSPSALSATSSSAGISPTGGPAATRHLDTLVQGMAALHGLSYATPALVRLAMRKIYLHRLRVVRDPALEERSVQWGSDADTVARLLLDGVGPDDIMDDVEEMVEAPV